MVTSSLIDRYMEPIKTISGLWKAQRIKAGALVPLVAPGAHTSPPCLFPQL